MGRIMPLPCGLLKDVATLQVVGEQGQHLIEAAEKYLEKADSAVQEQPRAADA